MGNCLETFRYGQQEEKKHQGEDGDGEGEERTKESGFVNEDGFGKRSGLRVKIVLTKEELEWLMLQLQNKGGKRLEDVLGELERGRGRVEVWKPSLESIMENPEVHEMER